MTFEEFKDVRYNEPPYDFARNAQGFARGLGSDISAHLPFLEYMARQCFYIVEFGTRDCYSTVAFLSGKPHSVTSYDIITTPSIETLKELKKPTEWVFKQQSTIEPDLVIPQCELLFLDTLHTYEQVKKELEMHASQVRCWLLFHDTVSFPEVKTAIDEFMSKNSHWKKCMKLNSIMV
jgi:hypothetical protein